MTTAIARLCVSIRKSTSLFSVFLSNSDGEGEVLSDSGPSWGDFFEFRFRGCDNRKTQNRPDRSSFQCKKLLIRKVRSRFMSPKSMSSPQKKAIRDARLEKIEHLLEEHAKSTFDLPLLPSQHHQPNLLSLIAGLSVHHFSVRCALCYTKSDFKCKIVSLPLNRSSPRARGRRRTENKADSKNTNQYARYVAQVSLYN